MTKDATPAPVSLTEAVLECLRSSGEMSDRSITADLTALVAYGSLQIEGWAKERSSAELVESRLPVVSRALDELRAAGRVVSCEETKEYFRWAWVPPKVEAVVNPQRGLW